MTARYFPAVIFRERPQWRKPGLSGREREWRWRDDQVPGVPHFLNISRNEEAFACANLLSRVCLSTLASEPEGNIYAPMVDPTVATAAYS